MSMSIGCVGCGNMGGAILAGLAASSLDCTLYGHTRTAARMAPLEAAGVTRLDSARELARKARYVVMAVKPYQIEALLAEMAPEFGPDTVVISVAAGISIARLQAAVAGRCPVVRCMPNTPALVGKGSAANVRIGGNTAISRVHASIAFLGTGFSIEDKASTNGTGINGNALAPGERVKLNDGDRITLGDEDFIVEIK